MNKKGLFFHFIVLGILLALGSFLVFSKSYAAQPEAVGQWHLQLVANTLQPAEINLLELDQAARDAGWEAALLLAKQGGFSEKSECGVVEGRNIWNKGEKWCIPVVKEVAGRLVEAKIVQDKVNFNGEVMRAEGRPQLMEVPGKIIQRYEYSTNTAANLAYSFDEYAQLEQEARSLVKACKSSSDLATCVADHQASHWQLCEQDKMVDGVGIFCVNSHENYVVKGMPVIYELGLRFGDD